MADKTNIEWTDRTWNVVTGCSKVSPGCDHCYMFRQWPRLHGMDSRGYEGPADRPALQPHRLEEPLHWTKPRRVFVCSMSDLFHSAVPFEYIQRVFRVMEKASQHTFQILTKRPGRMAYFANHIWAQSGIYRHIAWPDNVWAGTSLEMMADGKKNYAARLDLLAQVPARVRFVSAEPLLGPLDLRPWLQPSAVMAHGDLDSPETASAIGALARAAFRQQWGLSWCIAGGESGPGARPMHPGWVRGLRDQCQAAGVPYFFKQWGEWLPDDHCTDEQWRMAKERYGREFIADRLGEGPGALTVSTLQRWAHVGKKAAGAVLDGREHREFPA